MAFTELSFIFVFMPASLLFYLGACKLRNCQARNYAIAVLSILFYIVSDYKSLLFFFFSVIITFFTGKVIEKASKPKWRKVILSYFIVLSVTVLAIYKYVPFYTSLLSKKHSQYIPLSMPLVDNIIVPIGLSFLTFEMISYVVDVYRGSEKTGSFLDTFIFLSLYPKLISGPIVQWKDFKTQISDRIISIEMISAGIDHIIIGYAKKVIIADTLGAQLALINAEIDSTGVDTPTMWLKATLFFFEIYYDFSGYSDIAIGLCNIMGFSINNNFDFPYMSKSVSEFWRRWHISLGAWFREYLYIPLGGSRQGNVYANLFIVFLITGIWHGPNLTYVIWGIMNGIAVILERRIRNTAIYTSTPTVIKWAFTTVFIFFSWIVFSASDIVEAKKNIVALFTPADISILTFTWEYYLTAKIIIILLIAALGAFGILKQISSLVLKKFPDNVVHMIKRILLILLFAVVIIFAVNSTYSPFIYFQY